ncbi:MAG: hypothetical protein ABI779_10755 [Acidobacteriota bacterium]
MFVSAIHRITKTGFGALTSAIERSRRVLFARGLSRHRGQFPYVRHPRQSVRTEPVCFDGLSRHRSRLPHVDIRDRAFVPKPFASMTYRAILGRLGTLTSAIERSC